MGTFTFIGQLNQANSTAFNQSMEGKNLEDSYYFKNMTDMSLIGKNRDILVTTYAHNKVVLSSLVGKNITNEVLFEVDEKDAKLQLKTPSKIDEEDDDVSPGTLWHLSEENFI
jgi:hypothetical protein